MRILLSILILMSLTACGQPGGEEAAAAVDPDAPIKVVVTVPPLAWAVEHSDTKRELNITVLIPEGASPHGWEPTPSDALALAKAELVVVANDEDEAVVRRMGVPRGTKLFRLDRGLVYRSHPWLDNMAMCWLSLRVGDALEDRAFVGHRSCWQVSEPGWQRYRENPSLVSGLVVLTSHDAWKSFFSPITSNVFAVRHDHHDEPAAGELAALFDIARNAGRVLVVFETNVSDPLLTDLAEEIGAATVVLDPVGSRDWLGDMKKRYEAVAAALESLE